MLPEGEWAALSRQGCAVKPLGHCLGLPKFARSTLHRKHAAHRRAYAQQGLTPDAEPPVAQHRSLRVQKQYGSTAPLARAPPVHSARSASPRGDPPLPRPRIRGDPCRSGQEWTWRERRTPSSSRREVAQRGTKLWQAASNVRRALSSPPARSASQIEEAVAFLPALATKSSRRVAS